MSGNENMDSWECIECAKRLNRFGYFEAVSYALFAGLAAVVIAVPLIVVLLGQPVSVTVIGLLVAALMLLICGASYIRLQMRPEMLELQETLRAAGLKAFERFTREGHVIVSDRPVPISGNLLWVCLVGENRTNRPFKAVIRFNPKRVAQGEPGFELVVSNDRRRSPKFTYSSNDYGEFQHALAAACSHP